MSIQSVKTVPQKSENSWKDLAKRVLEFHESKQKEHGKSKAGRPDSLTGKQGWGIRDTARELKIDYLTAQRNINWGLALRQNPNFVRDISNNSEREYRLSAFLGQIRTTIFILKQDKRTVKIGTDLEKALKEYEG